MSDIIRKQMKDVIVPQNDIVRRQDTFPEQYDNLPKDDKVGRIEKNPFFEKARNKKVESHTIKGTGVRGILWALLFVLLLIFGFVVANYFSRATVDIEPIVREVSVNHDFSAVAPKGEMENALTFNFTPFVEEKTKEIPATIEKKIQMKASGKVVLYNYYSADSQRLIKNTRLESPDHKIYRVDASVVVPGAKVLNGKVVEPGKVEVVIYADAVGPDYNITKLVDFTIPGFKGDPRQTKFKAMSIPDSPISGGFSGVVKVPSDEAVAAAQEELKQNLKKAAVEKARAQIPDNMSLFPGSMVVKFEEVPQDPRAEDMAKVTVRANVSVFFFDTARLTSKLAELLILENKSNTFLIPNMTTLEFKFVDPVDNIVLGDLSRINFHITGTAKFVGQVDTQKIRTELAGKNKKEFSKIIAEQNNIGKADAVIRPMWKTMFPSDSSKITVNITS